MANFYEYGSTKAAVLDVDMKRRTVKGIFASFDTIDDGNDVFRRGAFTKTIMENGPSSADPRIKHLYNHWDAIGVIQDLKETNIGLEYVSILGRDTLSHDTLLKYEDGIITEHSVGYQTVKAITPTDMKQPRELLEVRLWEGSSLDKWGMNKNTPVLKSVENVQFVLKQMEDFERIFKKGRYTDDTFQIMELQYKQIKQMLFDAIESLKANQPPNLDDDDTQGSEPILSAEELKMLRDKFSELKSII